MLGKEFECPELSRGKLDQGDAGIPQIEGREGEGAGRQIISDNILQIKVPTDFTFFSFTVEINLTL